MKIFSLVLILISFVGCQEKPKRALPYLGNFDLEYKEVNGQAYLIPYTLKWWFEFTNHNGKKVTNKDYEGKVWISDFFFTSCPTICPTMTTQLKRLNAKLNDLSNEIQFLSFSIDPDRDDHVG